jgi:hypothetical protein
MSCRSKRHQPVALVGARSVPGTWVMEVESMEKSKGVERAERAGADGGETGRMVKGRSVSGGAAAQSNVQSML